MNIAAKLALIFTAGGLGTLSRFGICSLVSRITNPTSTLATSTVNILGCFCFGIIAESFRLMGWSATVRLVILTGFFGAFTTFSTYMYEIESLTAGGNIGKGILSFAVQNIFGFIGIALGLLLAKTIFA